MIEDQHLAAIRLAQRRRGLLMSSIDKREIYLRAFMRAMGPRSILVATTEDIEVFLDGRDIGPRTRGQWLAHLGEFYRWAIGVGLVGADPTREIVRPKLRRCLPRPAPTGDIVAVLAGASPQMRCWVLLAGLQGLRCREIAGLRREDVIETEGLLRVVGKGDHERMLPLHPDVLAALRDLPMPRAGWVFLRPRGGRYTANAVSRFFNAWLHDHGMAATAHQLRHWFATQLYNSTRDLRLTQEMLGHSSPETTAVYVAFDRRAAGEAIRALTL